MCNSGILNRIRQNILKLEYLKKHRCYKYNIYNFMIEIRLCNDPNNGINKIKNSSRFLIRIYEMPGKNYTNFKDLNTKGNLATNYPIFSDIKNINDLKDYDLDMNDLILIYII